MVHIATDGEAVDIITAADHWQSSWYPPSNPPAGTPHGSTGVCVVAGQVILVSDDGKHWQFRLVPPEGVWDAVTVPTGWGPIYRRILVEADIPVGQSPRGGPIHP
ncbi:hypothetical protein [Micromonospora sp. NPDC049204]|uniref:hypothetical protein n=1 Tax=Micromonospora sp. NPDC049204 TaxID=3154351 RepID=UPI003403CEE4